MGLYKIAEGQSYRVRDEIRGSVEVIFKLLKTSRQKLVLVL